MSRIAEAATAFKTGTDSLNALTAQRTTGGVNCRQGETSRGRKRSKEGVGVPRDEVRSAEERPESERSGCAPGPWRSWLVRSHFERVLGDADDAEMWRRSVLPTSEDESNGSLHAAASTGWSPHAEQFVRSQGRSIVRIPRSSFPCSANHSSLQRAPSSSIRR